MINLFSGFTAQRVHFTQLRIPSPVAAFFCLYGANYNRFHFQFIQTNSTQNFKSLI